MEHQKLSQWDNRPIDPAYNIENCQILDKLRDFWQKLVNHKYVIWFSEGVDFFGNIGTKLYGGHFSDCHRVNQFFDLKNFFYYFRIVKRLQKCFQHIVACQVSKRQLPWQFISLWSATPDKHLIHSKFLLTYYAAVLETKNLLFLENRRVTNFEIRCPIK